MIAGGMIAFTKDRIIEKIRKCSNRPVETTFTIGPPISVLQDQLNILGGSLQETRILKNQSLIIKHETGVE